MKEEDQLILPLDDEIEKLAEHEELIEYTIQINSRYAPTPRVEHENTDETRTIFAPPDLFDIRTHITRMLRGYEDAMPNKEGVYTDISEFDYQEALEIVAEADQAFAQLPHELQQRFSNPANFLNFLDDPRNFEEACKLGLIKPEAMQDFQRRRAEAKYNKKEERAMKEDNIANNMTNR